jgi:AcrR family transcriptional regulator
VENVTRVTRAVAQAQTRDRLLDAAAAEFAAKGYGGASLDGIAEAAGFTRGAVYSNFADKAGLFVAVLDQRLDHQLEEIRSLLFAAGAGSDVVASLRSPSWLRRNPKAVSQQWMLLYEEFRIFALRHPGARRRLAQHEQRLREAYATAGEAVLAQMGLPSTFPASLIGAMLLALDHDLNWQEAIDPRHVPATSFADAVELLLAAAVALGEVRRRDP